VAGRWNKSTAVRTTFDVRTDAHKCALFSRSKNDETRKNRGFFVGQSAHLRT
jgi:hypothetical protein